MILAIWYPSGAFGHFVNAVISIYGQDFQRPPVTDYKFGSNGHSHDLPTVLPKYLHDPEHYRFDFSGPGRCTLLIDNGINNESKLFLTRVPACQVLKIVYTDRTWPVIARTLIEKAMQQDLYEQLAVDSNWPVMQPWSQREKYFLYLRDHALRSAWRADSSNLNLAIEDLMSYDSMYQKLQDMHIPVDDFRSTWDKWWAANDRYFFAVSQADSITRSIEQAQALDLSHISALWDQAVINYFIWLRWSVEVPANDWADWFTNTNQMRTMLEQQGVMF